MAKEDHGPLTSSLGGIEYQQRKVNERLITMPSVTYQYCEGGQEKGAGADDGPGDAIQTAAVSRDD